MKSPHSLVFIFNIRLQAISKNYCLAVMSKKNNESAYHESQEMGKTNFYKGTIASDGASTILVVGDAIYSKIGYYRKLVVPTYRDEAMSKKCTKTSAFMDSCCNVSKCVINWNMLNGGFKELPSNFFMFPSTTFFLAKCCSTLAVSVVSLLSRMLLTVSGGSATTFHAHFDVYCDIYSNDSGDVGFFVKLQLHCVF